MKALLLKDCFVLCKQFRFLLPVLLLFCLLPGLSSTAFCMIYVIMLPITTLGFDERCKWDQLAAMMPYTPYQLVLSKYLLGYIGAGCVAFISLAAQQVSSLFLEGFTPAGSLLTLLVFPCTGLLMLALLLPLMILLGTEKGRLVYILAVGVLTGISLGLTDALTLPPSLSPAGLTALLAAVTLVVNVVSVRISVGFYQKRRL